MAKIQKLPEQTHQPESPPGRSLNAPASVLKELVENSLDSGPTQVAIDIWGAGAEAASASRITRRHEQRGCETGVRPSCDIQIKPFRRSSEARLVRFRGEALPSIAAVSHLELTTREQQPSKGGGSRLPGENNIYGRGGRPPGTTVGCSGPLFQHPVRAKFMKKDSTETRATFLRTVQELALAHPQVSFEISVEGKAAMHLRREGRAVAHQRSYGMRHHRPRWSPGVFPGARLGSGFINKVPAHQSTKSYQHLS